MSGDNGTMSGDNEWILHVNPIRKSYVSARDLMAMINLIEPGYKYIDSNGNLASYIYGVWHRTQQEEALRMHFILGLPHLYLIFSS